jgi:hypothetical protein
VLASFVLDVRGEAVAGHRIRHDRRSRVFPKHDSRQHRDELVPVDFQPSRVNHRAAVHISVKHHAQVLILKE